MEQLEKDPNVAVVVLTGNGKSFAAGADIKEIKETTLDKMTFDDYF